MRSQWWADQGEQLGGVRVLHSVPRGQESGGLWKNPLPHHCPPALGGVQEWGWGCCAAQGTGQ